MLPGNHFYFHGRGSWRAKRKPNAEQERAGQNNVGIQQMRQPEERQRDRD